LDPVLRQNARQASVTYPEVVNSNGIVIRQVVSRFIARPEILISARDLGVTDNYAPIAFQFTPVTFQNTGATLDADAEGPGNIEPLSGYTFSKLGVYSLQFGTLTSKTVNLGTFGAHLTEVPKLRSSIRLAANFQILRQLFSSIGETELTDEHNDIFNPSLHDGQIPHSRHGLQLGCSCGRFL